MSQVYQRERQTKLNSRKDVSWPNDGKHRPRRCRRPAEQAGRRPALVVSPHAYNKKAGLALLCPITSQIKGYPFEAVLPAELKVSGAVLCDQVKSFDWRARKARRIGRAPRELVEEILAKIALLLAP